MRVPVTGQRRIVLAGTAIVILVLLISVGLHLAIPRDKGVNADWSAKAVEGPVVADRALVGVDNTALDLRTGKTVTLGSVPGGTSFVADDRLIIVSAGRIDSVRLDATARWTWRSPAGSTATPLAAAGGSTLVAVCAATGTCHLLGLNAQGRQDWQSDGATPRDQAPGDRSLPRVNATPVPGGGALITDPVSGRSTLRAGRSLLAIPDGPVITELVQDGRCVVSAYSAADALWTRLLDDCPAPQTPTMSAADGAVTLTWADEAERLDLATGKTLPSANVTRPAKTAWRMLARAGGLTALESRETLHANPFRWGDSITIIQLRDIVSDDFRAQVVSDQPLTLLHLDRGSVVVREGDQVIRYTFDDPA